MEETRNWLEMPHEIMGGMILQRLGAFEMLQSAQKVCTTWRRICKDPAMWKIIDLDHWYSCGMCTLNEYDNLSKQAVHRSCGELINIILDFRGTDDLLDYISLCSSKLNSLRLTNCHAITACGLINALKRLPRLETLELSYINICAQDIEVIGRNCCQLRSFKMQTDFKDFDGDARAIGNSMPALRYLQLVGYTMAGNDGIEAILNGCPHLESLDLSGCFNIHLDSNLEKLCRERIKDFMFKPDNIPEVYEEYGREIADLDDFYDDYMEDYGIDYEDIYDGSWLY